MAILGLGYAVRGHTFELIQTGSAIPRLVEMEGSIGQGVNLSVAGAPLQFEERGKGGGDGMDGQSDHHVPGRRLTHQN